MINCSIALFLFGSPVERLQGLAIKILQPNGNSRPSFGSGKKE